jgi:homoserine O-succinyltransferase
MNDRSLRIGILNLMPMVETYEPYLLRPLLQTGVAVEPVWLRLATHRYASSDPQHIERRYRTFDHALRDAPLDGLLVSGAPVEEIPFDKVVYWHELRELLRAARHEVTSTLGLCWGGLALAALLGIPKHSYRDKLFGVFPQRRLAANSPFLAGSARDFVCAHSRHSGIADATLEDASDGGAVQLLAHGAATGYSIFESSDHRYLAHLGHPEYEAARLLHEWKRDRALRRTDVQAPVGVDPIDPATTWHTHRDDVFGTWLGFVADAARSSDWRPRALTIERVTGAAR